MSRFWSRIKKLLKIPLATWSIIGQAFSFSLLLALINKEKVYQQVKALRINEQVERNSPLTESELVTLADIKASLRLIEKYAPWRPMCYNRALTARKLLHKYHIPSKMFIGFRKKEGEMDGHAWVKCGNLFVTGYLNDLHTFNVLK